MLFGAEMRRYFPRRVRTDRPIPARSRRRACFQFKASRTTYVIPTEDPFTLCFVHRLHGFTLHALPCDASRMPKLSTPPPQAPPSERLDFPHLSLFRYSPQPQGCAALCRPPATFCLCPPIRRPTPRTGEP